jgi:hypothetical protein
MILKEIIVLCFLIRLLISFLEKNIKNGIWGLLQH